MKSWLLAFTLLFIFTFQSSAQLVTIPDVNFRNALLAHSPVIDTNNDGLIQVSEAEAATQLYLSSRSISNLSGIEFFTNILGLDCSSNNLLSVDVSSNLSLIGFECYNNNLTSIDVSNNAALKYFRCNGNLLAHIDLSRNPELRELTISDNTLTTLDLSQNPLLTHLDFSNNQITNIDIKHHTELISLRCSNNLLTSLDISCNSQLAMTFSDPNPLLSGICLNSTQYAQRTDPADVFSYLWTKSSNTSWTLCPSLPVVTPVPATIVSIDLCETGDMTFNAVSETFITNPTYTWQKASSASGPWVIIAGETNQSLLLTSLQMADSGSIYKVLISSADYCGTGHMEEAAGKLIMHPLVYPEVTAIPSVTGPVCDTIQQITYTATPVTGAGSAPSYQWYYYHNPAFTPIAGATDVQYTPAVLPPNGSQLFVGMFTDEMCAVESGVASNILEVHILDTPHPILVTKDTALCTPSGYEIQTSQTAAGAQFQWYKNGSPVVNSNTPNLTISAAGSYYMTEDNGACKIASGIVTIDALTSAADPEVYISSSLTGTACDTLQGIIYTAEPVPGTVTGPAYQWYNAATGTPISGATNAVYTTVAKPVNGDKVYVVMHTYEMCVAHPDVTSDILTAEILRTPAPVMLSTDTVLCTPSGYEIQTSQTAAGTQFQWYKNGSPVVNSNTPNLTISAAGSYYMTEDNGACKIASGIVTIDALTSAADPEVYISSSLTGTACDTLQGIIYTAEPVPGTVTGPAYQWYNAATGTPISGATNAVYTTVAKPVNGDKVYVVMHTDEMCVAHPDVTSDILTAEILRTPAPVMLSTDTVLCMPQEYLLTAKKSAGTQIQWYKNGIPLTGNTAEYALDPDELPGGSYHVSESNGACTIHSDAVLIELMQVPVLYPGEDMYASKGETVTFQVQAEHAAHYQWSPATGLSDPTLLNPALYVMSSETYVLQATNGQNSCPVSTSVHVIMKADVIIPNVITVNGDGINDTWHIENIENYPEASVEIFNRWGNMIWKSTGYSKQWDGSNRSGEVLPAGTYFYIVNLNSTQHMDAYTGYIQVLD